MFTTNESMINTPKNDIFKMCANTGCYCALSENAAKRDDLNNPSDDIIIGKMNG